LVSLPALFLLPFAPCLYGVYPDASLTSRHAWRAQASRAAMQRRIHAGGEAGPADEDDADLAEALGGREAVPGDIVSLRVGAGEGARGADGGATLYRRSDNKGKKGKRKGGDRGGGSGGKKHRK
jgi:hypothetical protein